MFRKKTMKLDPSLPDIMIGGAKIDRIGEDYREQYFKFVGIHLDEFLSWDYHVNHVCKKLSIANFALNG